MIGAKHRKANTLGGVFVRVQHHDNAEQTISLDRGRGWEKAGFGWIVPSHRRTAKRTLLRWWHDRMATHRFDWDEESHDYFWVGTCRCGERVRKAVISNGSNGPEWSPLRR